MEFIYSTPESDLEKMFGGFHYINAFGLINKGDADLLLSQINNGNIPEGIALYIDSEGGDPEEAIKIGRIIRENRFTTTIGRCEITKPIEIDYLNDKIYERRFTKGKCFSAATLVFMGGRLRYKNDGSQFGVHRFSFKNPSPENINYSQILSANIAKYIVDMGIDIEIMNLSSSVDRSSIMIIDEDELIKLNIINKGGETTWVTTNIKDKIYLRGSRDSIHGIHKIILFHGRSNRVAFWAFIESQGRDIELLVYDSVEIIDKNEKPLDVSKRIILRQSYNGFVNILIELKKKELKKIIDTGAIGIIVRYDNKSPIFFGISPMHLGEYSDMVNGFLKFR